MSHDFLEVLPALLPIDFLQFRGEIAHAKGFPKKGMFNKKIALPDHHLFLDEVPFAKVALFWNEEALLCEIVVEKGVEEVYYPDYRAGDSVELWIDTRDIKHSYVTSRFCHHFLILPKPVGNVSSSEITRFRSEDSHPLCDPDLISVSVDFEEKRYRLQVVIQKEALHGYDPHQFDRIGFTYQINRPRKKPQHFVLSSATCSIEQHPNLWGSFKLGHDKGEI